MASIARPDSADSSHPAALRASVRSGPSCISIVFDSIHGIVLALAALSKYHKLHAPWSHARVMVDD
ncbi:hypothetical protein THIX_70078 [Thiomonas sp. X19]|nr:hypothetical protein THIX_70078 [Thiomonas sp. X19]